MCLRLGIDLRVLHILVDNEEKPISATEVAAQSSAEKLLVGMCTEIVLVNVLLVHIPNYARPHSYWVRSGSWCAKLCRDSVDESHHEAFTGGSRQNLVCQAVQEALPNSAILLYLHSHNISAQVQMKMHEYFRPNEYVCPTDSSNCAFQWTFDTKLPYFEGLHSNPETKNDFNTFMSENRVDRKHWIDWSPVEAEILSGTSGTPHDTLVVDVGGGEGHDLT